VALNTAAGELDDPDLRTLMIQDAEELVSRLACGLTLERDQRFQQRLRETAGIDAATPVQIPIPGSTAWMNLAAGSPPSLRREPEPRAVPMPTPFNC
jgi:hypothetical protein